MPRPKKCRFVNFFPSVTSFVPKGANVNKYSISYLGYEELEAIRLADYEAIKQEEAAKIMNVSRATFGRIVERARYIIADALLNGKKLIISGGEFCCSGLNISETPKLLKFISEKSEKCKNCQKFKEYENNYHLNDNINGYYSNIEVNPMKDLNFKVAVVTNNGSTVNQHFGSATMYEVITVQDGQIINRESREKFNSHPAGMPHHQNNQQDQFIVNESENNQIKSEHQHGGYVMRHGMEHNSNDKHNSMIGNILDCKYLISRGMGYGIYNHLEAANIKPIITDIKLIEDAVNALINGTIVNHSDKLH